jgi:hypothetical protein
MKSVIKKRTLSGRTSDLPTITSFDQLRNFLVTNFGDVKAFDQFWITPEEICDIVEKYSDILQVQWEECAGVVSQDAAWITLFNKNNSEEYPDDRITMMGMFAFANASKAKAFCYDENLNLPDLFGQLEHLWGMQGRFATNFSYDFELNHVGYKRKSIIDAVDLWPHICHRREILNISSSVIEKRIDDCIVTPISVARQSDAKSPEGGTRNWYQAEDKLKNVRQVVLCGSSEDVQEKPRFGCLVLTRKFEALLCNSFSNGFFYLDSDPGPFYMARADHIANELRGSPVKVAFSFYRMSRGGLIGMYVYVDCPAVAQKITHELVLFEIAYGLDEANAENKRMVEDAIARDSFHLCFTDGKGDVAHQDGGAFVSNGLSSQFDMIIPISLECRNALKREWDALLAYHASVTSRDYNATVQQLWAENPQGENPILTEPSSVCTKINSKVEHPVSVPPKRIWWQFWK